MRQSPAGGYLKVSDAELLVFNLMAERISGKIVRAFAPDSVFAARMRNEGMDPVRRCKNGRHPRAWRLAAKEIENAKFILKSRQQTNIPRSRYLPRFREIFGDQQLEASL